MKNKEVKLTKEEFKKQILKWGMGIILIAFVGAFIISVSVSNSKKDNMIKDTYAQGSGYGVDVIRFDAPISINDNNFRLDYGSKTVNGTTSTTLWATKDNGVTWTDVFSAGVPSGTIVAFRGSTAPSGWAICDGTNGTPDLRGRFIRGLGGNSAGMAVPQGDAIRNMSGFFNGVLDVFWNIGGPFWLN